MEEREAEKQAQDVKNGAKAAAAAAVSFVSGNWAGAVITLVANLGSVAKLLLAVLALVLILAGCLILMPMSLIIDTDAALTDETEYAKAYERVMEKTTDIVRDGFDAYYPTALARGQAVKDSYGDAGEGIEVIVTPSGDSISLSRDTANGMMATYHVIQFHHGADVDDAAEYGNEYYDRVRSAVSVTSGQYSFFTCTVSQDITAEEVPVEDTQGTAKAASIGDGILRRPADEIGNPEETTKAEEPETEQQTEIVYTGTVVVTISARPWCFMRDELDAMLLSEGGTRTGTGTGSGSWPLPSQYDESYITSGYGWRDLGIGLGEEFHDGVDFGVPEGTEVYAIMDGTVFQVNHMDANTYPDGERSTGNCVYLEHDGNIYSVYMHLSDTAGLEAGDYVTRGQVIGHVGNTGFSSGPHLDLTVRAGGVGNECCVNPMDYISYGGTGKTDSRNYLAVMASVVNEGGHGYSNVPGENLGPDYDCGSFVSYALYRTGIIEEMCAYEPNGETAYALSSLGTMLVSKGFTMEDYSGMENLRTGDILVTDGHCETYYGNGKLIGAHNSRDGISITDFFEQDWIHVYRLEGVDFSTGSGTVTEGITAEIADVKEWLSLEFSGTKYSGADQKQVAKDWAAATEEQYSRSSVMAQLKGAGFSDEQVTIIMGWMQGEADYSDDPYLGYCSANAIINQVKNGLSFGDDGMLWGQSHYLSGAMYDRAYRSEWLSSSGKGIYLALQDPLDGITQCWGIYSAGISREDCFYVSDTVLSDGEPTGVW